MAKYADIEKSVLSKAKTNKLGRLVNKLSKKELWQLAENMVRKELREMLFEFVTQSAEVKEVISREFLKFTKSYEFRVLIKELFTQDIKQARKLLDDIVVDCLTEKVTRSAKPVGSKARRLKL